MPDSNGAQMTDTLLTPGEVAALVGIPSHSVRRWAQYHAAHLSDSANPGRNQPRRFTRRDVEVLQAAKPLHDRGVSVALINERLGAIAIGEIEQSPDTDMTTALQTAQEGPQSTPAPIVEHYAIELITQRIAAVERRQRDNVVMFLAGVLVSALFFLIIVIVFSLAR